MNKSNISNINYSIHQVVNNDYIDDKVIKFLSSEDFKIGKNNGHFNTKRSKKKYQKCYKYCTGRFKGHVLRICVLPTGIGIDIDNQCNDNLRKEFFKFKDFNNFGECYNQAMKYIDNF